MDTLDQPYEVEPETYTDDAAVQREDLPTIQVGDESDRFTDLPFASTEANREAVVASQSAPDIWDTPDQPPPAALPDPPVVATVSEPEPVKPTVRDDDDPALWADAVPHERPKRRVRVVKKRGRGRPSKRSLARRPRRGRPPKRHYETPGGVEVMNGAIECNRIIAVLHERQMTQDELSRRAGLSTRQLSRIALGKCALSLVLAKKIAAVLEQPVDRIFKVHVETRRVA